MPLSSQNYGSDPLKIGDENAESPGELPFWQGPGYRGEYMCPHGVGHGNHIHGCDGCCELPDFPLNVENIERTRKQEETVRGTRRQPSTRGQEKV